MSSSRNIPRAWLQEEVILLLELYPGFPDIMGCSLIRLQIFQEVTSIIQAYD